MSFLISSRQQKWNPMFSLVCVFCLACIFSLVCLPSPLLCIPARFLRPSPPPDRLEVVPVQEPGGLSAARLLELLGLCVLVVGVQQRWLQHSSEQTGHATSVKTSETPPEPLKT